MRRTDRCWTFLLCVPALSACDGIGRPVVTYDAPPGSEDLCPGEPIACTAVSSPQPLDVAQPTLGPAQCPTVTPGQSGDEISPPVEPRSVVLEPGATKDALPALRCERLVVQTAPDAVHLELGGWQASWADVTFRSEHPVTLVLSGARLSASRLLLDGAITLRLAAGAEIEGARIELARDATFALDEGVARGLTVISATGTGAGAVQVVRSSLRDGFIAARNVGLESSGFDGLSIEARELSALDVRAERVQMAVDTGAITYGALRALALEGCGSWLMADVELSESYLLRCPQEVLRLHGCHVSTSHVTGMVEAVDTGFADTILGAGRTRSWSCGREA